MDIFEARAELGIDADDDLAAARSAYRRRARAMHPDMLGEQSRADADQAMARLNQAWTTIRSQHEHPTDATPGSTDDAATTPRLTRPDECSLCGTTPATTLQTRVTTGLILFWHVHRETHKLCRGCGKAAYAEAQARSLVIGWWGVFAPFVNVFHMVGNHEDLVAHLVKTQGRARRRPGVVTRRDQPRRYRSPWRRGSTITATLAWLALVASPFVIWMAAT